MFIGKPHAGNEREIGAAFSTLAQKRAEAVLVAPNEFFSSHLAQLATLATRQAIPAVYTVREFPEAGGLMSYGPDFANAY